MQITKNYQIPRHYFNKVVVGELLCEQVEEVKEEI